MEENNRQLLDEVTKKYLEAALEADTNTEGGDAAFKQAMAAVDRQIEVTKLESSAKEQDLKKELAKADRTQSKWLKVLEIGATVVLVPVVSAICNYVSNDKYMEKICNFEKDYTFTTTPGKQSSKLFKFGK